MVLLEPTIEKKKEDSIDKAIEVSPILKPGFEEPEKDIVDKAIEKGKLLHPEHVPPPEDLEPSEPLLRQEREEPKEELQEIKPIQSLFPPRREALINYDWIDVANATGYVLYDGWGSRISTGISYLLTPLTQIDELTSSIDSGNAVDTHGSSSSSDTYNKSIDLNFDTTLFQLPRTIEGQAIVRLGYFFNEMEDGALHHYYVIIKIKKNTTQIGTIQSEIYLTNADRETSASLPITIPKTHFKKGDYLRLTVECWRKCDSADKLNSIYLAHNPRDTAFDNYTAGNSRLVLAIPFRMEI